MKQKPRVVGRAVLVPTIKKAARTLDTFRATHDLTVKIPAKIKAALEKLRKDHGDQAYVYEQMNPADDDTIPPLCKLTGLGANIISPYRDQFRQWWVEVRQDIGAKRNPRRVWFATVAAATKARGGPVDASRSAE